MLEHHPDCYQLLSKWSPSCVWWWQLLLYQSSPVLYSIRHFHRIFCFVSYNLTVDLCDATMACLGLFLRCNACLHVIPLLLLSISVNPGNLAPTPSHLPFSRANYTYCELCLVLSVCQVPSVECRASKGQGNFADFSIEHLDR